MRGLRWAVLVALVATPARAATTIETFDGPASDFAFSNGPEFPGATGALSIVPGRTGQALRLDYDFSCSGGVDPCTPAYVGASRAVAFPADTAAVSIWVRTSHGHFSLRVVDATGQTLQLSAGTLLPLEARATGDWFRAVIPISSSGAYWGGANDGTLHPPVASFQIVCDGEGVGSAGFLEVDDLVGVANLDELTGTFDPATATLVPAPAGAEHLADRLGVNIHFTSDDRALDAARDAGFRWVRMDLGWDGVERTLGTYDFSAWDALLDALDQRSMSAVYILDYGNTLHTGAAMTPPRSAAEIAAYGDFVAAAVAHYQGRSNLVFEVWNEPDIDGFWGGAPSASEYLAVLEEGLRRARAADPEVRILTGGLSRPYDRAWEFWDAMLASPTVTSESSGLGTHLYLWASPEQRWPDVLALQERLATAMPGRALWNTEWGHSSAYQIQRDGVATPVGLDLQAAWTTRAILTTWLAGLPLHVVYDLRDDGDDPVEPEHHFGMLARDYSDKPAMLAVRTLVAAAEGRSLDGLLTGDALPPGMHVAQLTGPTDRVYVVWAESPGQAVDFLLPDTVDGVTSLTGVPMSFTRGALTVYGERSPVYVYVPLAAGGAGGAGGSTGAAGQGNVGGAPQGAAGTADESASDASGCGCRVRRDGGTGPSGWGWIGIATLALRRRGRWRRESTTGPD